ncbi:hypothetical protein [Elizabethkingia anophelis]|uniref:hypothetical protein n=1 Tax=Elizabethkingia anophelis TaxID=1117645 RepID=UPI0038918E10
MLDFLIALFSNKIDETPILYRFFFQISNKTELNFLRQLEVDNIVNEHHENITNDDLVINGKYEFDIVWTSLRKYGFYITCKDFVEFYNKENIQRFYIYEIKSTEKDIDNFFVKNYNDIINIKEFVISLSNESIENKSIIYSENKYLIILNNFKSNVLSKRKYVLDQNIVSECLSDYDKSSKEIKVIFKNELINFLEGVNEQEKLKYLFYNFSDYYKRSVVGYEYYLSNFSYNKLKTELDNSILDFQKNIRGVINDSQTKLIAIPATVLLTFISIDTSYIIQDKNLFILLSSIIFTLLIHFFILNQLVALSIIKTNKSNYIKMFLKKDKDSHLKTSIEEAYVNIDDELKKQRNRLIFIDIINWSVPFGLLLYIAFYVWCLIREISF